MHIGKKMKELREAKKMSLTDLSKKSGVQIATLSRIENKKMTGTLESHINIAKALGVELPHLYHNLAASSVEDSLAQGIHSETFSYNDKASYEILTANLLSKKMMPMVLRIEEGGRTNSEKNLPGSERFLFVLEGKITVYIEEKTCPLSKNQTLYFDSSFKHHFENAGKVVAKVIVVGTPVNL